MQPWRATFLLWAGALLCGALTLGLLANLELVDNDPLMGAVTIATGLAMLGWVGGVGYVGLRHAGWARAAHYLGSVTMLSHWVVACWIVALAAVAVDM